MQPGIYVIGFFLLEKNMYGARIILACGDSCMPVKKNEKFQSVFWSIYSNAVQGRLMLLLLRAGNEPVKMSRLCFLFLILDMCSKEATIPIL